MFRGPRQRARRLSVLSRLVALLRVLAVVLSVQLGGIADPLADAVSSLVCDTACHHDQESPLDGPCQDCPPGCPSCRCSNALTSIVPELTAPAIAALLLEQADSVSFTEQAPLVPDLSPLFRPPRRELVRS